jgi:hypothetical protein
MITSLALIIGSVVTVPDTGSSGFILGIALLSLGVAARLIKNRMR